MQEQAGRRWAWAGFVVVGTVAGVLYAAASQQVVQEIWWQVITFGSAAAVLAGVQLHTPERVRPWALLFCALLLLAVMGLLGASWWRWPDGHAIWPLRDLGLVLGLVLLGSGTLALARARAPDGDPDGAIDGLIVMVALAAVLWDTVFGAHVLDRDATVASRIRFLLFPLLQAGVTTAAVRLLFLGTVRCASAWMIFGATSLACAGNVTWVIQGGGRPGLAVNLLWIASFLLGGGGSLHPSMRDLATPARPDAARLPFGRLLVLGAALVALPATLLLDGIGTPAGPPISAAGAVLCAGLVLWRLGRLLQERERASSALQRRAAREAALAYISGRALTSADPQTFLDEAVAEVRRTLDALACAIVARAEEQAPAAAGVQRSIMPLTGWATGHAVLVVDHPGGRRLDTGEQEFLQAIANVLVGAIRRWNIEQEVRDRALHDPLTLLPNRVLLLDRIEQALARSRRSDLPVSALFIDLDGFKHVNDSLGHHAGDGLLVVAAARLRRISRPQDTVARLAGDEFVVILDATDSTAATAIAGRVLSELGMPFDLDAGTAVVGASVGVATALGADTSAEQLLRDADAAMYRAKQRGRRRVEVFDGELRLRLSQLNEIEHDLRGAHERGELRLVYQPIVALRPGGGDRVVGGEALVRWYHPRKGLVGPEEFIGLAETRALIVPLGDWVLRQVCAQAALWRSRLPATTPLTVAVNVSVRQLDDPGFVDRLSQVLRETGAAAVDIVLELTETAVLEGNRDGTVLARRLEEVRALGLRIALDDFGTGYSSLTHLRLLPLDILKVDGSFVAGLGTAGREHAIVSALAGLTQELGGTVLAEGIETAEQLIAVRALGFNLAQGYYLGRPASADELQRRLGLEPAALR